MLGPALHSTGQLAAGQQDSAAAGLTLETDVRPEADHPPLRTAARMRFAQPDDLVQLKPD